MVVEPVKTKIKSIIKNNEHQQYIDCCHGSYYIHGRVPEKRLPTTAEIEREMKWFLGWLSNGLHWYHSSRNKAFFDRLAKEEYDQWKEQELPWPDFPIEVPSRIKTLSGYWNSKDKTINVPFLPNDLNDVRGFITAGNILYAGLKGYVGNHDMKCKTYVSSNIDFYIECWKHLIKEETGVDWSEL